MPAPRSAASRDLTYVGAPHLSRADLDELLAFLRERYGKVSVATGECVRGTIDELREVASDRPEKLVIKAESEGDGWLSVTVDRTQALVQAVGQQRVREDGSYLRERLEDAVPWYGQQAVTPASRSLQGLLMLVVALGVWQVLEQTDSELVESVIFLLALVFVNLNIWGFTLLGRSRIDLKPPGS